MTKASYLCAVVVGSIMGGVDTSARDSGGHVSDAEHRAWAWLAGLLGIIASLSGVVSLLAPLPNLLARLSSIVVCCCLAGLLWQTVRRLRGGRAAGVTRWLVASAASLVVLAGGIAMGAPGDEMTAPARPGSSSDTGEVWLTNLPEVDDYGGWSRQPMVVSGQRHSVALSTSPCWLNDDFTATFVVSRRYSQLDAHVGIADDSPVGLPLDFAVLIDGEEIFTTSAGLGELLPVSVDIASATQVTLRVSTTSTAQCHGDTTGVWVAPRLTKAT